MSGRAADDRSVADKLFAIADAFAAGEDLSLSEIATRARLPLSTAHRLVAEWVAWGGLVRGDDGRYRLGIKLWRLGARQPTARRLRSAALPYLEDLLESTREHVHLAVRDGLGAIYLERLSGRDAVPVISDVGSAARDPLHEVVERRDRLDDALALGDEVLLEVVDVGLQEVAPRQQRLDLALDLHPLGLAGPAGVGLGPLDERRRFGAGLVEARRPRRRERRSAGGRPRPGPRPPSCPPCAGRAAACG